MLKANGHGHPPNGVHYISLTYNPFNATQVVASIRLHDSKRMESLKGLMQIDEEGGVPDDPSSFNKD